MCNILPITSIVWVTLLITAVEQEKVQYRVPCAVDAHDIYTDDQEVSKLLHEASQPFVELYCETGEWTAWFNLGLTRVRKERAWEGEASIEKGFHRLGQNYWLLWGRGVWTDKKIFETLRHKMFLYAFEHDHSFIEHKPFFLNGKAVPNVVSSVVKDDSVSSALQLFCEESLVRWIGCHYNRSRQKMHR